MERLSKVDRQIKERSELRWIMKASWRKLTSAEKAARVVIKAVRFALIAAAVAVVGSVIIGTVLGIMVAMGIAGAFTGGFRNAGRANTGRLYGHYRW